MRLSAGDVYDLRENLDISQEILREAYRGAEMPLEIRQMLEHLEATWNLLDKHAGGRE